MDVKINAVHFDASESLKSFIEKKVGKMSRFFDGIVKADVSLKVEKPETAKNKAVALRVMVPGEELYADKVADSFEEAVDLCVAALEKQLVKYKEKQ